MSHKPIPWSGGKTPEEITKETKLEIHYRDGVVLDGYRTDWTDDRLWIHSAVDPENDIIAYRILE